MADRLFVNEELYNQLDLSLLSEDHMLQFFFFMSLGFKENKRKTSIKGSTKKKIMIIEYRLEKEHKALLTTLALNEVNKEYFKNKSENSGEGKFKMISFEDDKDEIYKIAEEYANGGMEYFKKLYDKAPLSDEKLIEREIQRYLKKINLE